MAKISKDVCSQCVVDVCWSTGCASVLPSWFSKFPNQILCFFSHLFLCFVLVQPSYLSVNVNCNFQPILFLQFYFFNLLIDPLNYMHQWIVLNKSRNVLFESKLGTFTVLLTVNIKYSINIFFFLHYRPFQTSHQSLENCKQNFLAWKKDRQTQCLRNNDPLISFS